MTATPWRTTLEAEHLSLGLSGGADEPSDRPMIMATHFVGGAVVVTTETATGLIRILGTAPNGQHDAMGPNDSDDVDVSDDQDEPESWADLRRLHRDRRGGRLFRFPGSDTLIGTTTVQRLVADTAIDDVAMIGHRESVPPDAQVDTQGFVRPTFLQGRIVLVVRPAANGMVVPFEQPDPTSCCTDH